MGKLEDMLASGRAPGILVRGGYAKDPLPVAMPIGSRQSGESKAKAMRRHRIALEAAARDQAAMNRMGRKRSDDVRLIGSSDLAEVCERVQRGETDVFDDRQKFLRDTGALFDHEK